MFTVAVGRIADQLDSCPWGGAIGHKPFRAEPAPRTTTLYTEEERRRRDESPWTMVQGILAPAQFAVFLVSVSLILRYLLTGEGEAVATASVVFKTVVLYVIMVTGSIWEHRVFGRYLFAPAFFWEDAVSIPVLVLHTAYVGALLSGALDTHQLMLLALAAYGTYIVNATQFVLKLRMARKQPSWAPPGGAGLSA